MNPESLRAPGDPPTQRELPSDDREQALIASELRYRRLFETAKDGILILDAETGTVVDVNPFLIEMLGYSRETFLGQKVWELGFFKDAFANQAKFTELQQRKYVRYENLALEGHDGQRHEVEFVSNVYQVDHHPVIQCNIRDITERKRAEEALARERALMRTMIDQIIDPIYVKDREGRFVLANKAVARLMGASAPAELLGKTDAHFYPGPLAAGFRADEERVLSGQPLLNKDEPVRLPDGSERYILTTKLPFRDQEGRVIGLLGVGRDITVRKQAELALANERALLRTLVNHLPVAVYLKDTTGRITLTNPQNLVWFNATSAAEILGKTDFDFFPPEQAAGFFADEQALMKSGQPLLNHEEQVTPPGGSPRWNLVSKVPLFDATGQVTGLAGIGLDITERKRTEAFRDRLVAILEATTDFVGFSDPAGHILHLNRAARNMLGFGPDEDITKSTIADSLPDPENNIVLTEGISAAIRDGQWSGEIDLLSRSGTKIPVSQVILAHKSPDGKLEFISTIIRDITERKRAEERLRLQAGALEAAANGIVITDPTGNIEWVNPAFTRLTGYEFAEVFGQNPRTLKSGRHDAAFYADLWQTILAGRVWRGEMVNKRKDGTLYSEELTITPVRNDAGKIAHFIAIKQDITVRKAADEALRQSEAEFHTLAEAMPQIVWMTRPDGWNIYFNQQWVDYTGLTLEESYGHGWNKPFHPNDRKRAWDAWQAATTKFAEYSLECRLRRADGEYHWWLVRGVPLRDAAGNVLKWFGTCTDIHENKLAEQKLQLFRALIERVSDGIEVVDPATGRILDANEGACRMLGYTREELLALTVFEVTEGIDHNSFEAVTARMEKVGSVTTEAMHRRKDGTTFPAEVGLSFVTLDRKYSVAIVRDITERKRAEDQVHQQLDELRRWQAAMMGREDRIMTLKREVNDLLRRHGEPIQYPSVENAEIDHPKA